MEVDNKDSTSKEVIEEVKEKKIKKKKDSSKELIEELKNKLVAVNNEALMAKADLVNYRKRKDEDVSKMLKYSEEGIITEVLGVVDNLERAISLDDQDLDDELSKFLEGFKMIYCNLVSILEKRGAKAIDGNNKVFDPTYHQAILTEHVDGVEEGMVLEVLQKGYVLKERVIRPAMVKVSE